jgi:calcium permeable stress-gated cation channel
LTISNSFDPLLYSLPLSLADKTYNAAEDVDESPEEKQDVGSSSKPRSPHEKVGGSHDDVQLEGDDFVLDGPKDFNHPASVEPQRTIWIPEDRLGLARSEIEDMRSKRILVGTDNATMDAKGIVDVRGSPPGEVGLK